MMIDEATSPFLPFAERLPKPVVTLKARPRPRRGNPGQPARGEQRGARRALRLP